MSRQPPFPPRRPSNEQLPFRPTRPTGNQRRSQQPHRQLPQKPLQTTAAASAEHGHSVPASGAGGAQSQPTVVSVTHWLIDWMDIYWFLDRAIQWSIDRLIDWFFDPFAGVFWTLLFKCCCSFHIMWWNWFVFVVWRVSIFIVTFISNLFLFFSYFTAYKCAEGLGEWCVAAGPAVQQQPRLQQSRLLRQSKRRVEPTSPRAVPLADLQFAAPVWWWSRSNIWVRTCMHWLFFSFIFFLSLS